MPELTAANISLFDIRPSCPTIISSEFTYEAKAAPILKAISGVIDSLNTPLTS